MANKDAAFGLKPIGKVGQNRDAQGLSEYSIAANATAIYQNDPVEMLNTGTVGVAAATDVLLGSLNGVFFTDATTSKPTYANHLDASNTATDIVGFVFLMIRMKGLKYKVLVQCRKLILVTVLTFHTLAGSSPNYVSKTEISGTRWLAGLLLS